MLVLIIMLIQSYDYALMIMLMIVLNTYDYALMNMLTVMLIHMFVLLWLCL